MSHSKKILNLLGAGLNSELAQKVVAADFSLTKLREAPKQELIQHFDDHEVELIWKVVRRKPIPPDTLQRLVEECSWKCCVCWNYQEDSPIIIHHIEEHSKTGDDSYDNLVILCLNHHAMAHSKWEISRHPLPSERIRTLKREWIEALAEFKAGLRPAPGREGTDTRNKILAPSTQLELMMYHPSCNDLTTHLDLPIPKIPLDGRALAEEVGIRLYLHNYSDKIAQYIQIKMSVKAHFFAYSYRSEPLIIESKSKKWEVEKAGDDVFRCFFESADIFCLVNEPRDLGVIKMLVPCGEADGGPITVDIRYSLGAKEHKGNGSLSIKLHAAD